MSFTKIDSSTGKVISLLNDKPNDVEGLSASDLKAKFDQAGSAVVDFLNNTLIPEIESNGQDNIIISAGEVLSRDMTLQEVLYYLAASLNNKISVQIPDRSISNGKIMTKCITKAEIKNGIVDSDLLADEAIDSDNLASGAVTNAKLSDGAVNAAKLADSAVTTAKLNNSSVTTAKILNGNVTTDKLADSAVTTAKITDGNITEAKLASGAVTTGKIGDSAVTSGKIASGNVTYEKLSSDAVYYATQVTLDANTTEWYKSVSGVTASNHIIVSPANDTSWTEWVNKGVRLSSQGAGYLQFASRSSTTSSITVNVLIIR